jgi:hypothetical protein
MQEKESKPRQVAQRSLAPDLAELEVSYSDEDLAFQPIQVKRLAVKGLSYGTSPVKSNPLVIKCRVEHTSASHIMT